MFQDDDQVLFFLVSGILPFYNCSPDFMIKP